jgi:hypothetical protein
MKRWIASMILLLFIGSAVAQTKVPISRSFMGFILGSTINDVQQKYTLEKASDGGNIPGEEVFRPKPIPLESQSILLYFLDKKLYKFMILFYPSYSERIGWDGFVGSAEEKYGPPTEKTGSSATWGDGKTILFLLKMMDYSGARASDRFVVTYGDIFLSNEVAKRKKALAPKF